MTSQTTRGLAPTTEFILLGALTLLTAAASVLLLSPA